MFRVNLNDATLRDLWMLSPDEGWLAGQNGTVIRLKPGQDTVAYWPVDEHLNALWMLDADIGFVVGDKGTALARNTAAMLEFKLSPDKQSYAWGAPVSLVLQKLNPQGAAALNGYYWEILGDQAQRAEEREDEVDDGLHESEERGPGAYGELRQQGCRRRDPLGSEGQFGQVRGRG